MNTPMSWIKAYVPDLDVTAQEYTDAMTLSGTKVEGFERFDEDIMRLLVYWVGFFLDGEGWRLTDIIFEVGSIAKRHGYTLEQVAEINIAKLRDRQARGVIKGNGDER